MPDGGIASSTKDADNDLVEHCIAFAQIHGAHRLFEMFAAIHIGLAAESDRSVIHTAYETAGVAVSNAPLISFEVYTLQ